MEKTAKALRTAGGLLMQRLQQGLDESNSNASGSLSESMGLTFKSSSKGLTMDLSMLDYYMYVDEGRKPGKMPPVSSIAEWLTLPNVREKLQEQSDAEFQGIQSLAFVIARKIGKEGTKGTKFFTNVVDSRLFKDDIPNTVGQAAFEDVDLVIGEILDTFD